ncbi:ABATE domain-containing protein [Saccharothrix sp. HUAS TT1]|uniref:CGNR zinc finger domain-containing protein n=1 Tax=unclassified Saccharothrix TaxID=2593673 RepID=UPI00345C22BC
MPPTDGFVLVLPDEPLTVRLMNTVWSERGRVHDALSDVRRLRRWVEVVSAGTTAGDGDLAAFRELRDALRDVVHHRTATSPLPPERVARAVEVINGAVTATTVWTELVLTEEGPSRRPCCSGTPAERLLSGIAAEAVDLLADGRLSACRAPGCVHHYVRTGRRQWCSRQCGNRVRVARHYRRQSPASWS